MLSNTPARKERSMKMQLGLRRSQGQGLQVRKSKSNTKIQPTIVGGYVKGKLHATGSGRGI